MLDCISHVADNWIEGNELGMFAAGPGLQVSLTSVKRRWTMTSSAISITQVVASEGMSAVNI